MEKLDLSKTEWRELYTAKAEPRLLTVPPISYLAVEGSGGPKADFEAAVEALYSVAYTLKFMVKKGETSLDPIDYKVLPLEAQWFMPDMNQFSLDNKDEWQWCALIPLPSFISAPLVDQARQKAASKKDLPFLSQVSLVAQEDGLAGQVLHVGSYEDEHPTIVRLHQFIAEQGCELTGRHREIYLGDPRRTAPEKLKTILRQPCRRR